MGFTNTSLFNNFCCGGAQKFGEVVIALNWNAMYSRWYFMSFFKVGDFYITMVCIKNN
ncbi:hypothetical protein DCCM_2110 [Desulfocucumis palustris]|uniref:Uncharacterized protein n=1 Tax=Desulfocucumis palustris TaxID=1898651 RepID=A0A2L2XBF6_9FIRM|nr:hypothetical protein DCCM_2110 [Desulfocucumis palustris]